MFQSPNGGYADYIVDDDGEAKLMRQDDGFHLNLDGANKLARAIEAEIEKEITARGGKLPAPDRTDAILAGCVRVAVHGAAAVTGRGHAPGWRRAGGPPRPCRTRWLCQARASRASTSQASSTVVAHDLGVGGADLAHAGLVVADDVGGELAGERDQLLVGHDVVDEAELQRLVGVEEVAGEAHLPRPAHADRLRQQHGEAPARASRRRGCGCRRSGPARRRRGSRS